MWQPPFYSPSAPQNNGTSQPYPRRPTNDRQFTRNAVNGVKAQIQDLTARLDFEKKRNDYLEAFLSSKFSGEFESYSVRLARSELENATAASLAVSAPPGNPTTLPTPVMLWPSQTNLGRTGGGDATSPLESARSSASSASSETGAIQQQLKILTELLKTQVQPTETAQSNSNTPAESSG